MDKKALSTLQSHQVPVGWKTAEHFPPVVIQATALRMRSDVLGEPAEFEKNRTLRAGKTKLKSRANDYGR